MAINKRLINPGFEAPTPPVPTSFNTVLYTGNSGTPQTVTGMGFQPDMVWQKQRTGVAAHRIVDSIRGSGNYLYPNLTNANDGYDSDYMRLASDGVYLPGADSNYATNNYVVWGWKAGGAAVATGGTNLTNRLVSANPEAGFSIMTYTGSGTDGEIEHGLTQAPELWFYKNRSLGDKPWYTVTTAIDGSLDYGFLNSTAQFNSGAAQYVTDTVIAVNADGGTQWVNGSGSNYVLYAFHSVAGFSKIGSYAGTNAPGNKITTGFEPAFVLTKRSSAADGGWNIFDNKRGLDRRLHPQLANAESIDSPAIITFNSDGFTFNTGDSWNNGNHTYIYMAFANQF